MLFDAADLLSGAARDEIFINAADAERLGVRSGDPIRLRSEAGEFVGRARVAEVARGCLIGCWPEVNVLIPRRCDPVSGEPDYNAEVTVERMGAAGNR
jgi:anaerobic selenocysteine-containing dehydrogenase